MAPLNKEETIKRIINLLIKAQEHAHNVGIPNIFHPGLVRDLIIANTLGHELILIKKDSDACDPKDPSRKYEYLFCNEGGSGRVDNMFKVPPKTGDRALSALSRNSKIYFAIFYGNDPLKIKVIYELQPATMYDETERQLEANENDISKVIFSEQWAIENSNVVYMDKKEQPAS